MSKIICLVALLFATPALAQQPCGPLPDFLARLKTDFQEIVIWGGKADAEVPLGVIITQSDAGAWTILQVVGNAACIVAIGNSGQILDMGKPS